VPAEHTPGRRSAEAAHNVSTTTTTHLAHGNRQEGLSSSLVLTNIKHNVVSSGFHVGKIFQIKIIHESEREDTPTWGILKTLNDSELSEFHFDLLTVDMFWPNSFNVLHFVCDEIKIKRT